MTRKVQICLSSVVFASSLLIVPFSGAQQKPTPVAQANISYELSREIMLQGTVVSFTANSKIAPLGSHVTIQTASGIVDVHLGNEALLKSNDIFLSPGDSVRIVGESQLYGAGSFFAARVLQKGSQSVTLRNSNGILLAPRRTSSGPNTRSHQGGAL